MKNDSDYGVYGFGTNSTFIEKTFCDFSKILLDNIEDWKIVTNNSYYCSKQYYESQLSKLEKIYDLHRK